MFLFRDTPVLIYNLKLSLERKSIRSRRSDSNCDSDSEAAIG